MSAQSLSHVQLFMTPVSCRRPGSSVHGIFRGKNTGWVTVSYSRGSSRPRDQIHLSFSLQHWQADSLTLRHLGSPYNGEVGHELGLFARLSLGLKAIRQLKHSAHCLVHRKHPSNCCLLLSCYYYSSWERVGDCEETEKY